MHIWLLGALSPRPPPGLCPWTPLGDFHPRPYVPTLPPNHGYANANWPHVRVLNERSCNFGEMGLKGEWKGTIWGTLEATYIRLLRQKVEGSESLRV